MPNGEKRLYCTRMSQVISYFTDDGEGGTCLWLECNDMVVMPERIMEELRAYILGDVAKQLNCPPEQIETLSIETLCRRLAWQPEQPRHPWQFPRTKSPARTRPR